MRCDHCEPLLLDHLYGLLDPADAAAVEGHLTGCGSCTAARDRARRDQGLFARAAKLPFPQVVFTPPAAEPSANGVAATVPSSLSPQPTRPGRRAGLVRWAVAAAVLLALLPGVLLPLDRLAGRYEQAKAGATAAADRMAEARAAIEKSADLGARASVDARLAAVIGQADAVLAEWTQAEAKAGGPVAVSVTKPATAQPGAPNEFVVAVDDKDGALKGKQVAAEVRDGTGAAVYAQPVAAKGEARVRVPAGVWAKLAPGAELKLAVAAVDPQTGAKTDLLEPVRLFGPVYTTLLTTDKAQYRPGERVLFRSITLDRVTLRPPDREQVLRYTLAKPDGAKLAELVGTTGVIRMLDGEAEPVLGPDGQPVRGVGCGAFALPANLADGDYTLSVTELPGRGGVPPAMAHPATRAVKVRAGGPERLAKQVVFGKASYAAGELVEGTVEVTRGGKPVAGAELRATATADDRQPPLVIFRPVTTDIDGKAGFKFLLPKPLARGDARLLITVKADGVEESVGERVPVVGSEVVVEFFPEGGALVAGVPNRVYVRATTPAGVPVDLRGVVSGPAGEAARVAAPTDPAEAGVNRGLAAFTFTPQAGAAYTLALDGKAGRFPLPKTMADGVALTVAEPVTAPGQPVRVTLAAAGKARTVVVGAYLRGRLADTKRLALTPGTPAEVSLAIPDARGGVVRVTAFEEAAGDLVPVAERLVFRKPGEALNLAVDATKPGELTVTGTDEAGKPTAAILWAAVVNAAHVPGPADRSPVTHFLLAGEVRTPDELEHADFLLSDHPKAGAALDLVLGTQGWRRFAEQKPGAGRAAAAREVDELLARLGAKPVAAAPPAAAVALAFREKYAAAARAVEAARKERAAVLARTTGPELQAAVAAYDESRKEAAAAGAVAATAAVPLTVAAGLGWGLVGLGAVLGVVLLVRAVVFPVAVGAVWAAGLGLPLVVFTPSVSRHDAGPAQIEQRQGVPATQPPDGPNEDIGIGIGPVAGAGPKVEQRFFAEFGSNGQAVLPKGPGVVGPQPMVAEAPPVTIPADFLNRVGVKAARPATPEPADPAAEAKARAAAEAHAVRTARAAVRQVPDEPKSAIREALMPAAVPLVAREYAAPRPGTDPNAPPADTLLWKPLIVLPTEGKTTLRVPPGVAAGGYQVYVAGHTLDGRLGVVRAVLPAAPTPPK